MKKKNLKFYSDLYKKKTTERVTKVEHTVCNVDELDDDIYFLIDGAIPVAASEIFDAGDFC